MTKPANFPGRKNARRSRALGRLRAKHGFSLAADIACPEIRTLEARVVDPQVAFNTFTKKDRSARGRLSR